VKSVSLLLKSKAPRKAIYGGIFLAAISGCSPEKTNEQQTTATTSVAQTTAANPQVATAEITNANNFALQQEPIYFPLYDLALDPTDEAVKHLSVSANGTVQPSQTVDTDGDGTLDSLLLTSDFAAAESKSFVISSDPAIQKPALKKQTQAEISIKEGGEWKGM
jgi:unsaturated rhamnogalacturonyl hydrolase